VPGRARQQAVSADGIACGEEGTLSSCSFATNLDIRSLQLFQIADWIGAIRSGLLNSLLWIHWLLVAGLR
jgi:hypothetical protein